MRRHGHAARGHAELRGKDDAVTAALKSLSKKVLTRTRRSAVNVGGVKERDARFNRCVDDSAGTG